MARPDSVLVISQLFNPDFGGLSTRAYGLALLFRSLGCRVTVLTTMPHYPDGYPREDSCPRGDGLDLVRLKLRLLPYRGFLNRVINFSYFPLACCRELFNSHGDYDLAVSVGFNPFSAIPLMFNGFKYVVDLSDLWPDTIAMEVRNPPLRLVLQLVGRRVNQYVFERSTGFILLNPNMHELLRRFYRLSEVKWTWIVNPADEGLFRPAKSREELRERLGIDQDSFVVLYHGVFGMLQGLPLVVRAFGKAFSSIRGRKQPVLYLIGHGEELGKVLRAVSELPPRVRERVKVLPRMPREVVANYVRAADLGLVPISASDALIYIVTPAKSIEYLASGVPILAPRGSFIG
ncbi:MAG: hypothetical protein DRK00_08335, partial [Thermoprotei archaeon]